jgi:hypothetical protein
LRQTQVASGSLEALDQLAASDEEHAPAGIDECVSDTAYEMTLAAPRCAEGQEINAAIYPFMPFC